MGIFDKIKSAIWGDDSEVSSEARPTDRLPGNVTLATGIAPEVASAKADISEPTQAEPVEAGTSPARTTTSSIDVAMKLDAAAAASGQELDWRHSIVDLLKALGMDASLEERRELATELGYPGDLQDSAAMNTFLHKALLQKLAENGGTVPRELLD